MNRDRFFVVERLPSRWNAAMPHIPWAFFSGLVLAASALLPADGVPGYACLFLKFTTLPCPFCGMTRAFIAAAHGHFGDALRQSPLALLVFAGTVLVFAVHSFAIVAGVRITAGERLAWSPRTRWIAVVVVAAAVALNWAYRLCCGLR